MPNEAQTSFRLFPAAEPGIEPVLARTARSFSRHFHDQFGIGVVLAGAQRSASGRGPVEAVRGDVITVNPGEVHDGSPIGGASRSWAMIYLDVEEVAELAADMSEGRSAHLELAHPVFTDPGMAALFVKLFRSLTTDRTAEPFDPTEALMLILHRLAVEGRPVEAPTRVPSGFHRARQAIDDDPTARHSLDHLASTAGLGRFRLIRAFAAETGLTPHAYLVQRRLHMARRLLRQGSTPAQASAEAGFADQSHMTRLFARTYGLTPGAYAGGRT